MIGIKELVNELKTIKKELREIDRFLVEQYLGYHSAAGDISNTQAKAFFQASAEDAKYTRSHVARSQTRLGTIITTISQAETIDKESIKNLKDIISELRFTETYLKNESDRLRSNGIDDNSLIPKYTTNRDKIVNVIQKIDNLIRPFQA